CSFKICPTCRPTYRERAYQSLNNILNNPVQMPPIWELQNRRVSDVRIVAQIGVPTRSRFYAHTARDTLQSVNSFPQIVQDANAWDPVEHQTVDNPSVRKPSGFRQTVRK